MFYSQKKKVEQKDVKTSSLDMPAIPADLSEEDTGRRRSARVRNMRARKKSPSPDYVPSDLDVSDDFLDDDFDDEFILKSKKRKKREPKEGIIIDLNVLKVVLLSPVKDRGI
jgi:hypothetical protein